MSSLSSVLKFNLLTLSISFVCFFAQLKGEDYPLRYEGVPFFQDSGSIAISVLRDFLPYNPIIIEAGAYGGSTTQRLSELWPQGKIYSFEPNPRPFELLQNMIKEKKLSNVHAFNFALFGYNGIATLYLCHGTYGQNSIFEPSSALLRPTPAMEIHYQGPQIEVPCLTLDAWCTSNKVDHIDLLFLELQGVELQVLMASPHILKTVQAIYTQTHFFSFREGITHYSLLKSFLEAQGFVLLQHWYREGLAGNAIFLSNELFDAFFKHCLGLNLRP